MRQAPLDNATTRTDLSCDVLDSVDIISLLSCRLTEVKNKQPVHQLQQEVTPDGEYSWYCELLPTARRNAKLCKHHDRDVYGFAGERMTESFLLTTICGGITTMHG